MPVRSIARESMWKPAVSIRMLIAMLGLAVMVVGVPGRVRADAKSALPAAVGDFKLRAAPQVFSPATLENHIDGEAEAVKHYDFRECAYGEYSAKGQNAPQITVDVYQMGDATNAYGYYSSQRNPSAQVVKIGAEGYQEPTALNFWKGPYYVKVTITASPPGPLQPAMPRIAQAIAAKVSGATSAPEIIKLLPPGYAPRTEQYRRSDIAAQSYIRNGMVARYPKAGSQAELFVAVYPTPAAAADAYKKYQAYLSDPSKIAVGQKPAPVKGVGAGAIAVRSKFTGEVVAAYKGKYLIGVRKAKDRASAESLAKAAVEHVH